MSTYIPTTAPRRPGADDFKAWPSRFAGEHREVYSPPVGPCAGMQKSKLNDAEKKRLRSLTWRGV